MDGEADPQGHQGHHPGHHLAGLVSLSIGLLGDLVGGHGDLHGDVGSDDGNGDQDEHQHAWQTLLPESIAGHSSQIHAQEREVHGNDTGAGLTQGGLDGSQNSGIAHGLDHADLSVDIGLVGHDTGDTGDGLDHVGRHAHHVGQGLTDDAVQADQHEHGDQGPQAAAHGVDLLLLIQLLNLLVVALGVLGVLSLQLVHLAGEHVHLDHALLALQGNGEQDEFDHEAKQDQCDTIAVEGVIQEHQQHGKGFQNNTHECYLRKLFDCMAFGQNFGYGVVLDTLLPV